MVNLPSVRLAGLVKSCISFGEAPLPTSAWTCAVTAGAEVLGSLVPVKICAVPVAAWLGIAPARSCEVFSSQAMSWTSDVSPTPAIKDCFFWDSTVPSSEKISESSGRSFDKPVREMSANFTVFSADGIVCRRFVMVSLRACNTDSKKTLRKALQPGQMAVQGLVKATAPLRLAKEYCEKLPGSARCSFACSATSHRQKAP